MIQLNRTHRIKLQKYYKYHSKIYDATRWSFLFGRQELLSELPELTHQPRILEVGCGTGKNISFLEYLYPDATIIGVDLSEAMLVKARQKTENSSQVNLFQSRYGSNEHHFKPFDLILLSYSLTMIGENVDTILQQVHEDLKPSGYIAVVDFHETPIIWFRRWMLNNHVEINGTILPLLKKYFAIEKTSVKKAYLGLWKYFSFLGKRS